MNEPFDPIEPGATPPRSAPPTERDPSLVAPAPPSQGLATASMITGIVSLVIWLPGCLCAPALLGMPILGAIALTLGLVDWGAASRAGQPKRGMATAGVVCGAVAIALFVLMLGVGVAAMLIDQGVFDVSVGP